MHYDDVSRRGNLVGGFLVGAVLGAGLALLLAPPHPGAAVRRRADRATRALRRQAGTVLDDARERAGAAGAKALRRFQL